MSPFPCLTTSRKHLFPSPFCANMLVVYKFLIIVIILGKLKIINFLISFQGQDTDNCLSLLDSAPHSLIQVKSDPENLGGLCSSSGCGPMMTLPGPPLSSAEAAEDAQTRGQLLQEISHVAETFDPYSSPPTPPGCYKNFTVASDTQSHTDFICVYTVINSFIDTQSYNCYICMHIIVMYFTNLKLY